MVRTYCNFDLEAFDYKLDGSETFDVRVADSPAGQQSLRDAEEVTVPSDLHSRLRLLEKRSLDQQGMMALGEQLGNLLFPTKVREMLFQSRARLKADEGLRIRLRLDTYELGNIPWEYTYVAWPGTHPGQRGIEGFLALDTLISLVRSEVLAQAPPSLDPVGERDLRMVALFDDPATQEYPALQLDVEEQKIRQALSTVANIKAEYYPDATIEKLEDVLVNGADILHFSGHGVFKGTLGERRGTMEGKGYLVLMSDNREPLLFAADKLALNLRARGVRLTMLGSCEGARNDGVNAWSGVAAALTRAGIPAVVAMQYTVRDSNVIHFSRAFYRAVAEGQPVDTAVTLGRMAIFNQTSDDERDWGVPVLYLRGSESIIFPRPQSSATTISKIVDEPSPPVKIDPIRRPESEQRIPDKRKLREAIVSAYSIEDLELLCADLEQDLMDKNNPLRVSLDIIGGSTLPAKVLNLIDYMDRRGHLGVLANRVRKERPNLGI